MALYMAFYIITTELAIDMNCNVNKNINRYTIWPEILAGNLFWRIGGFESNPPNFLQYADTRDVINMSSTIVQSVRTKASNFEKNGTKIVQIWSTISSMHYGSIRTQQCLHYYRSVCYTYVTILL